MNWVCLYFLLHLIQQGNHKDTFSCNAISTNLEIGITTVDDHQYLHHSNLLFELSSLSESGLCWCIFLTRSHTRWHHHHHLCTFLTRSPTRWHPPLFLHQTIQTNQCQSLHRCNHYEGWWSSIYLYFHWMKYKSLQCSHKWAVTMILPMRCFCSTPLLSIGKKQIVEGGEQKNKGWYWRILIPGNWRDDHHGGQKSGRENKLLRVQGKTIQRLLFATQKHRQSLIYKKLFNKQTVETSI